MKRILACVVAMLAWAAAAWGAEGQGGAVPSRQESIRQTLAAIDQQVKDHGGSWEKWSATIEPYRDDIRGCVKEWQKYKWPWRAKKNYVFQGAAVSLHLREELENLPEGERPFEAISHFNKQLKALGIDLIVAFIPAKLSIHPDYIQAAVEGEARPARAPQDREVSIAVKRLMHRLLQNDVEVIDLHEVFRQFRLKNGDDLPLYYVRDGHFINRGARVAAEAIGQRLKRYDFVQAALSAGNPYIGEKGARTDGDKADSDLLFIKDKRSGRAYADVGNSPVLMCGDSHMLYNDGTGALVSAQVAHQIGMPLSRMGAVGLAAAIPVEVAKDPQLGRRKVVILFYTERMLAHSPGKSKWPLVNLPGAVAAKPPATAPASAGGAAQGGLASGVIAEISTPPDAQAPYPHYLMTFYLKGLVDQAGKPIGEGDAVVRILAMHNRKFLPITKAAVGEKLTLSLTAWTALPEALQRIRTGILPTVQLELDKPLYWGEVPGQPALSSAELARVGEEDAGPTQPAKPDAEAAHTAWRLDLDGCVSGKPLAVYIAARDQKPWKAFGLTPGYNKAVHEVDASGLKLVDDRAKGTLAVTIKPDAWVPTDGKPVAGRIEVDAAVSGGKLSGSYTGKLGDAEVKGAVKGEAQAAAPIQAGSAVLTLENALKATPAHAARVNLTLNIEKGKSARGTAAGFAPTAVSAKVESIEVTFGPDTLAGAVKTNVTSAVTPVTDGAYSFELDGIIVGTMAAGTFKAALKDQPLPGGVFYGTVTVRKPR